MKSTDNQAFTRFFLAECDYFGYIEGSFKDVEVQESENILIMHPFEYNFTRAIADLHEFIINDDMINEFPKAKWNIYLVDGSMNDYGDINRSKVYSISSAKAKKLLLR